MKFSFSKLVKLFLLIVLIIALYIFFSSRKHSVTVENVKPLAESSVSEPIGEVIELYGEVRAVNGGKSVPLALKDTFIVSDTIITGSDGRVKIMLRDDTVITLGTDSELELTDFAGIGEALAFNSRFLKGTLGIITGKITEMNPEGFAISTPHATAGIRGTVLAIRTDEQRSILYVLNTDKTVIFNGASVAENYKAIAETGNPLRVIPLSRQEKEAIIKESDLAVEEDDKLQYVMTVYFPFGKVAPIVGETERKMFEELDNASYYFLFGHTDIVKTSPLNKAYADNAELSLKRAEAVKAILEGYGKSSEKISTSGLGATQPAVENSSSPNGTLENRRVEIFRKRDL